MDVSVLGLQLKGAGRMIPGERMPLKRHSRFRPNPTAGQGLCNKSMQRTIRLTMVKNQHFFGRRIAADLKRYSAIKCRT